jgi:hypothetical protein
MSYANRHPKGANHCPDAKEVMAGLDGPPDEFDHYDPVDLKQ